MPDDGPKLIGTGNSAGGRRTQFKPGYKRPPHWKVNPGHSEGSRRTQFKPGNQAGKARIGEKRGPYAKTKVEQMLHERIDRIADRATRNVLKAIDNGSIAASTWFLEHIAKTDGAKLGTALIEHIAELDEEGLLALSEIATRKTLAGELGEKQLKLVQDAISYHARMLGIRQINALRTRLYELEKEAEASHKGRLGLNGHTPLWGRFRKQTHVDEDGVLG